jgi:hypothetical protein
MNWASDISFVCQNRRLNSYVNASCLTRFWFLERIANCHGNEPIKQFVEESVCRLLKRFQSPGRSRAGVRENVIENFERTRTPTTNTDSSEAIERNEAYEAFFSSLLNETENYARHCATSN